MEIPVLDTPRLVLRGVTLADVASAWTLLVLPVAAAAVVKAHDYLAQSMPPSPSFVPETGNPSNGVPGKL